MQESATLDKLDTLHWHALYTRPRFEKKVGLMLQEKGIESFVPLRTVRKRWSDRWKKIEEPLFSCYVFVRVLSQERMYAIQTDGVIRMVNFGGKPSPIPDEEIEAVKRILTHTDNFEVADHLAIGQVVKVTEGPFEGICGCLIERRGKKRLLVGIKQIRQALCIEVDDQFVKPVQD